MPSASSNGLARPPGAGALHFTDPRPAVLMADLPLDSAKTDTPASREPIRVQPRGLQLVICPSWLEHGVDECECDKRTRIAFNGQPVIAKP
ncbi:putative 2OG-Fe(II) oxygenase [Azohydromonas sediminis]|uniref:putative 2OG-Fe(II) oxygenase n=1 Tax=Azohydromonas sediminis TaxID=2259674 RepID=UPI000E659E14|nr:putative 2OG-Fe(II) oxygenase [Azohydromonas sediminis]